MTAVDVSAIVVTWNRPKLLRTCLESLRRAIRASSLRWELLVVDNGSTAGDAALVEREFPEASLIRSPSNIGFACANNLALKRSSGRSLLLVNNDVRVSSGMVDELCQYLEWHPEVGIVGPQLILPDGTTQQSWGRFLTPWRACLEALHIGWLADRLRGRRRPLLPPAPLRVDWVSGGCFLIRREVIDRVGDLDPRYFFYSEDMDWCRRARRAGWEVHYLPQAAVLHDHAGTAYTDPSWYAWMLQEGRRLFLEKYYGHWSVAAFRLATLVGSLPLIVKWQLRRGPYAAKRRREARGHLSWALRAGRRSSGGDRQ